MSKPYYSQRPRSVCVFLSTFSLELKDDGSGGDNWSCKTCKAPVKFSPPTPNFLQTGCPSCHQTSSVETCTKMLQGLKPNADESDDIYKVCFCATKGWIYNKDEISDFTICNVSFSFSSTLCISPGPRYRQFFFVMFISFALFLQVCPNKLEFVSVTYWHQTLHSLLIYSTAVITHYSSSIYDSQTWVIL